MATTTTLKRRQPSGIDDVRKRPRPFPSKDGQPFRSIDVSLEVDELEELNLNDKDVKWYKHNDDDSNDDEGDDKENLPPKDNNDKSVEVEDVDIEEEEEEEEEEWGDLDWEEEWHCLDKDKKQFFQRFAMEIGGEGKARALAKNFCMRAFGIARKHKVVEDPVGAYSKYMKKRKEKSSHNAVIYVVLSEDGKTILKGGATGNWAERKPKYVAKGIAEWRLRVLIDLELTGKEFNDDMEELYKEFLETMQDENNGLHPFQRLRFELLDKREGDRLGSKKMIWLQLIESGFQMTMNLPSPQEFLMFDPKLCHELYKYAREQAEYFLGFLTVILDKADKDELGRLMIFLIAIASWKPGHARLSSKILATKCTVGDDGDPRLVGKSVIDTLPFAAIENPVGAEEIFNTSKYTPEQKAEGRTILRRCLQDLLASKYGVVFLDTNKLILDDDPASQSSAHVELTKLGFEEVARDPFGEIVLYRDPCQRHAVFVHYPLGLGFDSRQKVPLVMKVWRGCSNAILANIGRTLRGMEMLTANDKHYNPINGILAMQIAGRGDHLSTRTQVAFGKACLCGSETNPRLDNNLRKSKSRDTPVSLSLRRLVHTKYDRTQSERPQDNYSHERSSM